MKSWQIRVCRVYRKDSYSGPGLHGLSRGEKLGRDALVVMALVGGEHTCEAVGGFVVDEEELCPATRLQAERSAVHRKTIFCILIKEKLDCGMCWYLRSVVGFRWAIEI